ncbi:hypothetical protein C8Q80DRAFT_822192 [Daedaleopsis nitida]|nr:hypothetical protein C8Q80DRAFT_822192 [Daedaleopsis nitida]
MEARVASMTVTREPGARTTLTASHQHGKPPQLAGDVLPRSNRQCTLPQVVEDELPIDAFKLQVPRHISTDRILAGHVFAALNVGMSCFTGACRTYTLARGAGVTRCRRGDSQLQLSRAAPSTGQPSDPCVEMGTSLAYLRRRSASVHPASFSNSVSPGLPSHPIADDRRYQPPHRPHSSLDSLVAIGSMSAPDCFLLPRPPRWVRPASFMIPMTAHSSWCTVGVFQLQRLSTLETPECLHALSTVVTTGETLPP